MITGPPYQYNYDYQHKVMSYNVLGEKIKKNCFGQVIVCEAVCPKSGKIPEWLPFVSFRESVTSRRKANQSHHSKEVWYYKQG